MKKLLIFIFIQFFCFNISYSKNIDVQQDLNLDLDCKFQKLQQEGLEKLDKIIELLKKN